LREPDIAFSCAASRPGGAPNVRRYSRLIGPRTQEQLDGLLSGADIELTGDILDRIDEIVSPGTELDPADNYAATPPPIERAELRRRPPSMV
jgi:hypothetical protein